MGINNHIIEKIQDKGFECFQTDRFNLDNELMQPYQDIGGNDATQIFERNKKLEKISVNMEGDYSLFKYFLDGSRYTYKIADIVTSDNEFFPVVAGQIGVAICLRENGIMKSERLCVKYLLSICNKFANKDKEEIRKIVESSSFQNKKFNLVEYNIKGDKNREKPENAAIGKILNEMHNLEIECINDLIAKNKLKSGEMLIIDGSLQFMDPKIEDSLFEYVIGVSKSFNPNFKNKNGCNNNSVATTLANLEFGERTPVFRIKVGSTERVLGTWYVRIRERKNMRNPLDGILKIDKVAVTPTEKANGFEEDLINAISASLVRERNTTCYGSDERWSNHLYPIYVTEKLLKTVFVGERVFMNVF